MDQPVRVASGLNVLLSIWLIASPFLLGFAGTSALAMWDAVIVGAVTLILAWIRFGNPSGAAWPGWVNAILGLWMILSPFLLGMSNLNTFMWDAIVVGIGFVIFGAWSALESPAAAS